MLSLEACCAALRTAGACQPVQADDKLAWAAAAGKCYWPMLGLLPVLVLVAMALRDQGPRPAAGLAAALGGPATDRQLAGGCWPCLGRPGGTTRARRFRWTPAAAWRGGSRVAPACCCCGGTPGPWGRLLLRADLGMGGCGPPPLSRPAAAVRAQALGLHHRRRWPWLSHLGVLGRAAAGRPAQETR